MPAGKNAVYCFNSPILTEGVSLFTFCERNNDTLMKSSDYKGAVRQFAAREMK